MKRRFDDTEYLEQSRDIVDNVKNAVAAGTFSPLYHCGHMGLFSSHDLIYSRSVEEEEKEGKVWFS